MRRLNIPKMPEPVPLSTYADNDGKRRYGFYYCDYDVRFYVRGNILEVAELVPQTH